MILGVLYPCKKFSNVTSVSATVDACSPRDELSAIHGEEGHQIKYQTCSWQKIMFGLGRSFSVLGMVPGVIVTCAVAAGVQYTSLVLWKFCMKHPEARDVCDIGKIILGGSQIAYHFTAVMFLLNNIFIMGLHCLVGAKLLNTLSNGALCSISFSAISAVICFTCSLPRTLKQMSWLGVFSAATMGIAVLLAMIFSGVQDFPPGFTGQLPIVTVIPVPQTTYIAGMSAFLNISYTLIGQITIPSFIAEMRNPKDFPTSAKPVFSAKALWACTTVELTLVILCGAIMYHFIGNQYIVSPAFGSLQPLFKKIAFSFAIPTIVYLGALYASVSARFIFFRIFSQSYHRHSNTAAAWMTWAGILVVLWVAAFIIAEIIPFFSDLLSLMSSLFGMFIYWGLAYLILYPCNKRWNGFRRSVETLFNYFLVLFGLYILIAGTYVSNLNL
ncbi:transmembrane amino acid transporter protein-domain-containing protein [Lentinula edodes]|nr:transmembrane amino acid transporter protein-domain-containing protein [Lentinula edodes]